MSLRTTAGQLAETACRPEELRSHSRVLDKKEISKLLQQVAEKYPERYREIAHDLSRVGYHTAQMTGGNSFGLEHLRLSQAGRRAQLAMEQQAQGIYADQRLDDKGRDERVVQMLLDAGKPLEDAIYQESLDEKNPLASQVLSGARGNKTNLRALRGGDLLYVDHHDNPIPIPILRSYSQGFRPVEYFAGTFGARKGVIDTKMATQDAGFFSKQLNQLSHRLVVTARDADGDPLEGDVRGVPVDTDDADNEGALLAHPVGDFPRNTLLTPAVLSRIKARGHDKILVRSPITGGPADGGLYGRDVGVREKGDLSPVGDFVGIAAAQALSEPLAQAQLSSKHSGGVAGTAKGVSGFKLVNQLVQTPTTFKGGAAHAEVDGRVQKVEDAPQGGTYVTIDGQKHYVGTGYAVHVKQGDEVEAGDVISEGIPNPAKVVQHKGVGEGRRYFVEAFRNAYRDSGITVHRRNVELVARGLIDHVRVQDEMGDHIPGDVIPYSRLEHGWSPREGHQMLDPQRARGMYLERPVLHYSIGTRVRPSVIKNLQQFGVAKVAAHHEPPPFEPEMIRGMETLSHDPDWMTRFLGSYLKKNLLQGASRGAVSDSSGTSYVPALAEGSSFGRAGKTVGWSAGAAPAARAGSRPASTSAARPSGSLLSGPTQPPPPPRSILQGVSPPGGSTP